MVFSLSTHALLPIALPASSSYRKSLVTFLVPTCTSPGLKFKVQSSLTKVNGTEIALNDEGARTSKRVDDLVVDHFVLGRFLDDSLVFRQNFSIRSYEIGADGRASIETLMNLLQETALNHAKSTELLGDGFGSTMEMCKRNLIWVVAKMQVTVDRYPIWRNVIAVDTWVAASGKNGMRREWLVRDNITGDIIAKASSMWVMMNQKTRKLAKIPVEVHEEIDRCLVEYSIPVVDMECRKLPKLDDKTADSIRTGLTPKWNDLDMNQHVNNVKYVGWIVESVPLQILKTRKIVGMSLEYHRECMSDSVLQSLTSVVENGTDLTECQHLLCLEGGGDIVKGMTKWKCQNSL